MADRRLLLAVAAITALGAALRLLWIGDQSIWLDEALTASYLDHSFSGMLSAVSDTDATPPVYFALAWLWAQVFGTGEVALRSLPALLGIATIPVAFLAGRELFASRAGLIGAALLATNPLFAHYSQEARAYALMVFLTTLALLAAARVLRTQARGDWAVWLVASALAVGTHYAAAFAVVPIAVWLLVRCPIATAIRWVGALGLIGAAMLPSAAASQAHVASAEVISSISLQSRVEQVAQSPLLGDSGSDIARKVWAAALLVLAAVAIYGCRSSSPYRRNAIALTSLGAATLVLAVLAAGVGVDGVLARYLQSAWVPLILVVAAGTSSASSVPARALMTGVMVAVSASGSALAATESGDDGRKRDDWRTYVPQVVGGARGPAATVLAPAYNDVVFRYYAPDAVRLPASGARLRELDIMFVFPHGAAAPLVRVVSPTTFIGGYAPASRIVAPAGFTIGSTGIHGRLTLVRLVSRAPRRITPAMVQTLTFTKTPPVVLLARPDA